MVVELIKIKDADDGMRLNRWFLKYYPELPMSLLQKLVRTKQVKIDGKRCEVSDRLVAGQEVRVPPFAETTKGRPPKEMFLKDVEFVQSLVIYKDRDIIALNKPSGIAVQGGSGIKQHIDGMLPALNFEYEEAPKLVHRIDRETSGILLLARNRKTAEVLTKAFRERKIEKAYLALVMGCPEIKSGEIRAELTKIGERMQVCDDGQKAVTRYRVLEEIGDKFVLLEAYPLTGRTHQIRVHLESVGMPIVGDDKYFGNERKRFSIFADRLYLHAYKIDLSSVFDRKLEIKAELPDYFAKSLNELGVKI